MGRTLLAVLLGAVVHFLWGWASWEYIGWHDPTVAGVPDDSAFVSGLGGAREEEKVYIFPKPPPKGASKEEQAAWGKKVSGGVHGVVMVNIGGLEPMSPQQMLNGFLLEVIATVMVVFMLVVTLPTQQNYLKRVFIVIVMGVFAGVTRDLMFWNWMSFPLYYTAINVADTVVGWTAAGLVIAALVKPTPPAAGAMPARV